MKLGTIIKLVETKELSCKGCVFKEHTECPINQCTAGGKTNRIFVEIKE